MNLSRESMLALQRHFLGALSAPARTWLEPLPLRPLAYAGDAVRAAADGCTLDLGSVTSPGEERHFVRVCNRGTERIDVRLGDRPEWLTARWTGNGSETVTLHPGEAGAQLEIVVAHDAEQEFHGTVQFLAGSRVEELRVRMTARREHPLAVIDFNGTPVAQPYEFDDEDRPYRLSVQNATSIPLLVKFAELPDWLTLEVDSYERRGPVAGPFFERVAPFAVTVRPHTLGRHSGALRMSTNDPRPELQNVELRFTGILSAAKPCVRIVAPRPARMRGDQIMSTLARLENWGRSPARTAKHALPGSLDVREWPVVPAAEAGQPGTAVLPIRITPAQLVPGTHALPLSFRVVDGDPPIVDTTLHVSITSRRKTAVRTEMIAALFAVLLLTLLIVVARGWS